MHRKAGWQCGVFERAEDGLVEDVQPARSQTLLIASCSEVASVSEAVSARHPQKMPSRRRFVPDGSWCRSSDRVIWLEPEISRHLCILYQGSKGSFGAIWFPRAQPAREAFSLGLRTLSAWKKATPPYWRRTHHERRQPRNFPRDGRPSCPDRTNSVLKI